MSHEIRTPLGIIQGFAELAMNEELPAAERRGFLQTIRRNSVNLTKLIGGILDLSKVESGVIELENTHFSLRELVSEVITSFELQARKKGLALIFSFEDNCPAFITSDLMRLRQILINVIGNSLKFTSQGEISLKLYSLPGELNQPSSFVQFLIKDTGIGITSENQSRLFQPFMQADSSTTRKFGGTGLGLSLSKKLAQALGGDLKLIESTPGQGSTFEVKIKTQNNLVNNDSSAAQILPDDESEPVHTLNGMNVLLVEDSEDNQLLFSTYLIQAGAEVDIGADGHIGLSLARQKNYDVILMDVQMPNLDGFAATAILRAEGFSLPIIALTSHALKEDRDRALACGFSHYLTKPLDSNLLVETLVPLKRNSSPNTV